MRFFHHLHCLRNRTIFVMAAGSSTVKQVAPSSNDNGDELTKSVLKSGRFINPWPTFTNHGASDVFKLMSKRENRNPGIPSDKKELDEALPAVKPNLDELKQVPESGMRVTWLGHASLLVQLDGISVLTDPIFSQRCSPFQFIGPKRYRPAPCSVDELPKIDAIVISHNHYDHLDHSSVVALNRRFGEDLCWFVPLGIKRWLTDCGCKNVVELDWWESLELKDCNVTFVCTPCQHFSNRGIFDRFKTLWCSWVIKGPTQNFYFAGDTGYCDVFKQIGKMYGPFDLAAIPIGAYEPRWFMECIHVDPAQAVLIHKDVMSKKSIGIHWGTFVLTREFYLEPPQKLRESLQEHDIPEDNFFVLNHGESRIIG